VADLESSEEYEPGKRAFDDPAAGAGAFAEEPRFLAAGVHVGLVAELGETRWDPGIVVDAVETEAWPEAFGRGCEQALECALEELTSCRWRHRS
jgi:hypothetical protein